VNASTADILTRVPEVGLRLDRQTARDAIAGKLKTLIATEMLRIGDHLPSERELAEVLGVSRSTVRGAVQVLAAQGWVEVSQGSRTRVAAIDLSHLPVTLAASRPMDGYDLESVHAARLHLELFVVGEATDRIGADTLSALERLMEGQRGLGGDATRFLISDREFHVAIYRACGNPLLADLVTDLYTYMIQHRRQAMSQPGAIAASPADHEMIVAGLRARDRARVVGAFAVHLDRIRETTRAIQRALGAGARGPQ